MALIKNLRSARTQQEFELRDEEIVRHLHPSIFAELDWMEMTMPDSQKVYGSQLVDGIFIHHLPYILSLRRIELDLDDQTLLREVSENFEFYTNCVGDERQPLSALGDDLNRRIQSMLKTVAANMDDAILCWCEAERSRIVTLLSQITDPSWILLNIDVEIKNALVLSLDHVSSRMRTKQFLRHTGGRFPEMGMSSIRSQSDIGVLCQRLHSLAELAQNFTVFRIVAVCRILREVLSNTDISRIQDFCGQLAAGYGHCGNCSMMYASTAIVSFDTTCPDLFAEGGLINLPLSFNVSVCSFCGTEQRDDAPTMFYSPKRHQVIYNFPQLGQFTQEKARQIHRPVIDAIRNEYMSHLAGEEARNFELAMKKSRTILRSSFLQSKWVPMCLSSTSLT